MHALRTRMAIRVTEIIKRNRSGMITLMITHQPYLHQYADEIIEVESVD